MFIRFIQIFFFSDIVHSIVSNVPVMEIMEHFMACDRRRVGLIRILDFSYILTFYRDKFSTNEVKELLTVLPTTSSGEVAYGTFAFIVDNRYSYIYL